MRAFVWDLIRGGHYGQRPRVPRKKAEHTGAPTNAAAYVKKALANPEPSTHGGKADMTVCGSPLLRSLLGAKRTCPFSLHMSADDPKRTLGRPLTRLALTATMPCVEFLGGHETARVYIFALQHGRRLAACGARAG
jgi:hypothetical protein